MKIYATLVVASQVKRNLPMLQEMEYQRKNGTPHKNFLVTIKVGSETNEYVITDVASPETAISLALYKCARKCNKEPSAFSRIYRAFAKAKPLS